MGKKDSTVSKKSGRIRDLTHFLPEDSLIGKEAARIFDVLKNGMYTRQELKALSITQSDIDFLRMLGYTIVEQYEIRKKNFVQYGLVKGQQPFTILPTTAEQTEFKCAELSDVHIGSNQVDLAELELLLTYLWQKGYRILAISGDLFDGIDIYNGHRQNTSRATLNEQADTGIAALSKFDFWYVVCDGNHHRTNGVSLLSLIEKKMVAAKKQFTALKSAVGYVDFGSWVKQIVHLDGSRGNNGSETYAPQRYMDNMYKSAMSGKSVNGVKIFGVRKPILEVTAGHYHGTVEFSYGNAIVKEALTLQHTTEFIGRRGIDAKTGARVTDIVVASGKCLSYKSSIIFGEDVIDIFEIEAQFARSRRNLGFITKSDEAKPLIYTTPEGVEIDGDRINRLIQKLSKAKHIPFDELGMTMEEIDYVNGVYHYDIHVNKIDNTVVWKTETGESHIVYSSTPQSGIVTYMELSNAFIGSVFFDAEAEEALRSMLDRAVAQGVEHINLCGNMVWGVPSSADSIYTTIYSGRKQVEELVRILSAYPKLHFYSINGRREQSLIEAKSEQNRINPMIETAAALREKGVKFVAINSNKCDFVVFGLAYRMFNTQSAAKTPYTIDVDIRNELRAMLAKCGNEVAIKGVNYYLGAICYGATPVTFSTHYGGIYATATAGPSHDSEGIYRAIKGGPEGSIINSFMKADGDHVRIVKFEREIITP